MTTWREVFARRSVLWAAPLGLFLLALVGLGVYRWNFAGESAGLERRLEEREAQLRRVVAEREELEALLGRAELNQKLIDEVYQNRFATRRARLTAVTTEVKTLARRAGLEPSSLSYPEEQIEDFGVVERKLLLPLTGTYQELRGFINLLELSPSFLMLRRLDVDSDDRSSEISVRLELSTLFAAETAAEPVP